MSDLNKAEKIIMSIVYGLTVIALIVISFVIYNIVSKEKPQTLGTVYASTLSCTEKDINIIEVNIFSNENGNGASVYEVMWNGYVDYQGGAVKGFGMQTIDPNFGVVYKYNTDDLGTSSYIVSKSPTELYFDIDGQFYKYQFEKYGVEKLKKGKTFFGTGWNALVGNTEIVYYPYNYSDLFKYIVNTAKSDSAKHTNGEFAIPLLDLSQYIKILYQDEDTQYHSLPKTSTMYEFFKVKVTYSKDGMTDASQSMFKQLNGNSSWNFYNNTEVEDYWNAYADIVLTENNINYIYDESQSSYYALIDETFATYLGDLSYAEIFVNLDFSALDFDIYAIDLKNFNFKVEEINIKTNKEDFVIYNQTYCKVVPTLEVVA